jgi:hypothetical protein
MIALHHGADDSRGMFMVPCKEKAMRDRPLINFQDVGLTLAGRESLPDITLAVGDVGLFKPTLGREPPAKPRKLSDPRDGGSQLPRRRYTP